MMTTGMGLGSVMGGLLEIGGIMMAASERRLETVSSNIANTSTPGFKKEVTFQQTLAARDMHDVQTLDLAMTDALDAGALSLDAQGLTAATQVDSASATHSFTAFSQGALRLTGKPLDLAISGAGFFRVRSGDRIYYSRGGQFERAADGGATDAQGLVLQAASGGDLVLGTGKTEILEDGTVLQQGLPVARLALYRAADEKALQRLGGGLFAAPEEAMQDSDVPLVRSGMLEGSNVQMADEMVEMMTALRQAEAGARIIQVYDALAGQSISTFGQGAK